MYKCFVTLNVFHFECCGALGIPVMLQWSKLLLNQKSALSPKHIISIPKVNLFLNIWLYLYYTTIFNKYESFLKLLKTLQGNLLKIYCEQCFTFDLETNIYLKLNNNDIKSTVYSNNSTCFEKIYILYNKNSISFFERRSVLHDFFEEYNKNFETKLYTCVNT